MAFCLTQNKVLSTYHTCVSAEPHRLSYLTLNIMRRENSTELGLESEVIAISTWPLAGDTCKPQKELLEECLFLNQMSAALVLIL